MKTYRLTPLVLALAMILSACGGGGAASSSDPTAVLEALEAAHNAKDPDGVAALYAEDGYEVNGDGKFTGRTEIRDLYARVVNLFSLDCKNYEADGNSVHYECVLTTYSGNVKFGERYEAIVENGLIQSNVRTETFTP